MTLPAVPQDRFIRALARSLCLAAVIGVSPFAVAQETKPPSPAEAKPAPTTAAKDLPSASEVIHGSTEAMGGRKAIDAIESSSIKGKMSSPMMPAEINMEVKSATKNRLLMKQELPGMGEGSAGSDGTTAWKSDPMSGGYQLMTPEETKQTLKRSSLYSILFDLENDFTKLETVDKTTFNGEECYKLLMVDDDETTPDQMGYFSVANKLMVGMENNEEGPMGPVTTTFLFKDWKTINDVKVFTGMEIERMGMAMTMQFTEVEFNKVDPAVFELPAEVKKLVQDQKNAGSGTAPQAAPATQPAQPAPQ